MEKYTESVGCLSKRRKLNRKSENDESDTGVVAASLRNEGEQKSEILKLPIELFENIFNYLPLKYLVAAGETCKLLKEVAGHHFNKHYSNVQGGYTGSKEIHFDGLMETNLDHFIEYIPKMMITSIFVGKFLDNHTKFRRLKHIRFYFIDLRKIKIHHAKTIMSSVEYVQIDRCDVDENFLEFFPNMKRLTLRNVRNVLGAEWFECKYPQLKRFELTTYIRVMMPVTTFLELNQNVRIFETNIDFLWDNLHSIQNAKVSFDELAICFNKYCMFGVRSEIDLFKRLKDQGLFKKLSLYFMRKFHRRLFHHVMEIDSITKLSVDINDKQGVELSSFTNLRELCFPKSEMITDVDAMARKLKYLERIHFEEAKLTHIMPFFKKAENLRKIKINVLKDGGHFDRLTKIISLTALNKERSQLQNAVTITLYVTEDVYLATKLADWRIDLEFINLKHLMSHSWDNGMYTFDRERKDNNRL